MDELGYTSDQNVTASYLISAPVPHRYVGMEGATQHVRIKGIMGAERLGDGSSDLRILPPSLGSPQAILQRFGIGP
jgi:hypothetical protein